MRNSKGQFAKGHHWRKPKPHWNKEWLKKHYVANKMSSPEIAKLVGCKENNIHYWLQKHDIKRRSISEIRKIKKWGQSGAENPMYGKTGNQNPRYVDGSSPERQRLYSQGKGKCFIKKILKRDSYKCQRCGSAKKGRKSLHVHHIRPWAGNPKLRFVESNVITLCSVCHNWVHSKQNINLELLRV